MRRALLGLLLASPASAWKVTPKHGARARTASPRMSTADKSMTQKMMAMADASTVQTGGAGGAAVITSGGTLTVSTVGTIYGAY